MKIQLLLILHKNKGSFDIDPDKKLHQSSPEKICFRLLKSMKYQHRQDYYGDCGEQ